MREGIGRSSLSELDTESSESPPAAKQSPVGRSTLSQQLVFEDHPRERPMFEGAAQWEDIDPAEVAEPQVARAEEGNLAGTIDQPSKSERPVAAAKKP
jgi:hypothetical protein